jgi:hypothetical protein
MQMIVAALTALLSASPDQLVSSPANRAVPEAPQTPSRVIQTLPRVTFGGSRSAEQPRSAFADEYRERAAAVRRAQAARTPQRTTTICGLTMTEQSPDLDAQTLLPSDRSPGAAVRRIEPQACAADRAR